jgi:hypothetical protein
MMYQFWELFKQSVITQAVITFMLWLTICIIYMQGRIPDAGLLNVGYIVLGFWFGTKVQNAISTMRLNER